MKYFKTTTYWQHPDHLGSASWVTDTNGRGYQHLQYRAWGEPFIDQRVSGATYESRYTFSGKERDEETGFSYFGARHYNAALSIWLSVDPMSDKYPSTSPYTYGGNNPVRLVDPNGREIWLLGTEEERNNAFQDLQAGTNLSLKMDENGLVVATGETINGEKLSRADKKLLTAISDQNVRVDIFASPNNEENSAGGAYMGTIYDPTTNSASSCTNVNLAKISITERDYNANQGSGIIHEATEGYAAGLIAIKKASSIKEAKVECSPKKIAISADNNKLDIMYFNDYNPAYPKDYKLYQKSHRRATPAPNK